MAASKNYQIRSISLPCRLHTTATRIGEELTRLINNRKEHDQEPNICHGLFGLQELYKSLHHLLNSSPMARQAIARPQNSSRVGSLLDVSIQILDICGITRDLVVETRENLRDLQSGLRTRGRKLGVQTSIAKYISLRKVVKKNAKKLALIKLKAKADDDNDQDDKGTGYIVKIISEVNSVSFTVFESLLEFLASSSKTKLRSMVPKWLQKDGCKDESLNELERVDEALRGLCKGVFQGEIMASLKCLEDGIQEMENGLDGLFRQLIRTRASLLNILSQ
ncbi:uncharacterized protein LOC124915674 [Impatiens glandulifera]|uniref:uncharacterized protein LOC124915674 n=1 Tax=Impatiens glandulifera TaxID=253017 RepID=UPI001FB08EA5|nr:uncharacterized protein LOC124915674 [Impatiens glandulifera]